MRSSTSSSESLVTTTRPLSSTADADVARSPVSSPLTLLLTFVVSFGLFAGAVESVQRARGVKPSVSDDAALWVQVRHDANRGAENTLAVIGKSRVQLGFSPATATRLLPGVHIAFLPRHGVSAAATLIDLAEDKAFVGSVLFSLTEIDLTRGARSEQSDLVTASRADTTLYRSIDARAGAYLQSHFSLLRRSASLRHLVVRGPVDPLNHFFSTASDRAQVADFGRVDAEALRAHNRKQRQANASASQASGGVKPGPWLTEALELERAVKAIQARGGQVFYLKFPACSALDAFWETHYPRARFWDALAARTSARTLHYRDIGLGELTCPDDSHIAAEHREAVTEAIVAAMKRKWGKAR